MQNLEYNHYKIKKIIDKYDYISFDIFDTLIKRNVEKPTDVFEIVSIEYQKKYNKVINDFKEKRILAELKSRDLVSDREPNIDDIYKNINLASNINAEALKKIEEDIELAVCQQNIDFYEIYKYALEKNKKVIITSDMYLKKDTIKKILEKAQISKYEKIYLSNEVKLNKHNGKIYSYIIKDLKIKSNQIVHIGDSKRGDYIQPYLNNIKGILIPKRINKLSYYNNKLEENELLNYNILQNFINNNMKLEAGIYYNIGYEILGPLLYGYSKWLLNNLEKNKIEKIFFLAREGNLLKKAFDIINNTNIESQYIYISRRSIRPALLQDINNLEDLYKIIKIKDTTNVKKFFRDVGLDYKEYQDIFKKYNFNEETKIKDISNMNEIFEMLKNDIKRIANEEKKTILGYLNSKKFEKNTAISDVGWAGTMQQSLCVILKSCNIVGFYMATTNEIKNINKNAYLDSYEKIRPFVHLFENLFLAQHGTTLKYEFRDNKYEPILDEYEYSVDEMKIFIDIQNGALKFIEDINYNEINKYLELNSNIVSLNIMKLGLNPTLNDIKKFKNIPYVETVKLHLIEAKNLIYYIFNLKKFKEDYLNSGWKIGFLKSVFKINLPYLKIYNFLLKFKEKQ